MINLSKLSGLLGNDKQIICRFLNLYCENIPLLLTKLKSQLSARDYENASITAHEIKSQSDYLGLENIVLIAATIERDTEECKTFQISELYENLLTQIKTILPELQKLI